MKSQRKKHGLRIIKGRIDNHISIPRFLGLHLDRVLDHPLHELGRYGTTALLHGGLALLEGIDHRGSSFFNISDLWPQGARNRRTTRMPNYIHCMLVFICFKSQGFETRHVGSQATSEPTEKGVILPARMSWTV